jgi:drug/metabolite transporter (DMT)-like permease
VNHKRALLLLVVCASLWSIGGVLIKSVNLPPLAIAGIRGLIAAMVLALVARKFKFVWTKAQILTIVSFAYTTLAFVTATKMTTAANAILLQFTAPIYVALLSGPLLGERITKKDVIALLIVLCGIAVFFMEKLSTEHMLGNLVALTSGLSFAGIALGLRMQKGQSTFESLFAGHLLTAAIGIPFVFMGDLPTSQDMGILLTLGVVQLGIPYVLYGIAVRYVTALEASMVPVIEPILNPVWVALFMSEVPSKYSIIGGLVVIAAVMVHTYMSVRTKPLPPPID